VRLKYNKIITIINGVLLYKTIFGGRKGVHSGVVVHQFKYIYREREKEREREREIESDGEING